MAEKSHGQRLTAEEAVAEIMAICNSLDESVIWSVVDARVPDDGNSAGEFQLTISYSSKGLESQPKHER